MKPKEFLNRVISYFDGKPYKPKQKIIETVFICDPNKNIQCKKTHCQTKCFFTKFKAYSKDGKPYHAGTRGTGIRGKDT